jgi:5-methylcytosine-specific restriction protein A
MPQRPKQHRPPGWKSAEQNKQEADKRRGTSSQRGYGSRWRKLRSYFLANNPLCLVCQDEGKVTPATVVDHHVAHKGDESLFWDINNLRPMCVSCHSRKTARQDGRWG